MPDSDRTRILILAQTNPTFSKKYIETVCTAGLLDIGKGKYKWVRIYPIEKRALSVDYHKFQWISCMLNESDKNNDTRPESRKIIKDTIQAHEKLSIGHKADWELRRHILLHSGIPIITRKQDLLDGAKDNKFSLCLFKPTKVCKFTAHNQSTEFTEKEQALIDIAKKQGILIDFGADFSTIKFSKIPYYFKCVFEDEEGKVSRLSVLDWEMSSLFRKEDFRLKNQIKAMESTLKKYNDFIENKDIYFILGTRLRAHRALIEKPFLSINPWSIISVIAFPKTEGGEQTFLNGIF